MKQRQYMPRCISNLVDVNCIQPFRIHDARHMTHTSMEEYLH